jgi:hypothetical protein
MASRSCCRPSPCVCDPALLGAFLLLILLYPSNLRAQALQQGARPTNYFDPTGTVFADIGDKNMPNLYYLYVDPTYVTGSDQNKGFKDEVVQQVVRAVQGLTQPTYSTVYNTYGQTYKYLWSFFGLFIFCGLLLSGWQCYHDVIAGKTTNDTWLWYAARITVAVLMWTSIINAAPSMMISFIDQFTGLSNNSLTERLKTANTDFTDSNAYMQDIASGKITGNLAPYLTAVAVAYNTLDKTTVMKSAQAISSVVDFKNQLGFPPQDAEAWIENMYNLSYQIHLDSSSINGANQNAVENAYGMNMAQVTTDSKGWFGSFLNDANEIAAKMNNFTHLNYSPSASLSPEDQVVATFLASQKAASEKFYIQTTNRLRAIANQPLLPVPGVTGSSPDDWLGTNSQNKMPAGLKPLRFPNSAETNQNNTNPDNTQAAAGMLENAIPQPGEAPPVSRLVHQPALVKNVVNFAMVEIGISIWSLPLLLMMTTLMLLLPPHFTGKSHTHHLAQTLLQVLTILLGCALITVFIELATMNSATDLAAIVKANKDSVNIGGALAAPLAAGLFGAYDPATIIYTGLILASMPIAVGIVQGSNKLASAAWGALNASGMSGVTATEALQSGHNNTLGAQIIRATSGILTEGVSDMLIGGGASKPRAPTSPSE